MACLTLAGRRKQRAAGCGTDIHKGQREERLPLLLLPPRTPPLAEIPLKTRTTHSPTPHSLETHPVIVEDDGLDKDIGPALRAAASLLYRRIGGLVVDLIMVFLSSSLQSHLSPPLPSSRPYATRQPQGRLCGFELA